MDLLFAGLCDLPARPFSPPRFRTGLLSAISSVVVRIAMGRALILAGRNFQVRPDPVDVLRVVCVL